MGEPNYPANGSHSLDGLIGVKWKVHLLLSGRHTAPGRIPKPWLYSEGQIDLTLFTAEIGFQINTDRPAIAISMICMLD